MPDFVLKDGREIEIDLSQISSRELRSCSDPTQDDEEEYALIGRVIGWSVEDTGNIPQPDYRLLLRAIMVRAVNPVADPN